VLVGVLLSGFFFAHKVGRVLRVTAQLRGRRPPAHLRRGGPGVLCLGRGLHRAFDFKEVVDKVRIDVSRAHFWDITAISALDKVVLKFRREGTEVEVIGLDEASATLVDRFAVHDKPEETRHE
jgi:SulP family sulfate permease